MKTPSIANKLRIGIFFGGKSAEHDVSLQSAKNVLEALDKTRYEPVLIGISKTGKWHAATLPAKDANGNYASLTINEDDSLLTLTPGTGELIDTHTGASLGVLDAAFPVLHGPFGEDGTIQGMLELAGVPYVGPNVLGSAAGMDKDVMKRLLRDAGIPISAFHTYTLSNKETINSSHIFSELGKTVFVKPANMGSSVGVSKAETDAELQAAVTEAFRYDTKIIIESNITGDEIECAVLGNRSPEASIIGRIIPHNNFYSYEAKYIDADGATLEMPAAIAPEVSEKARALALKTFTVLCCEGMGRVDMFATKEGEIFVNEINTIPGFTKISMYPKLWELSGVSYQELITRLITLAIERHIERRSLELTHSYPTF